MTAGLLQPYTNPLVLFGNVIAQPNSDAVIPSAQLSNPNGLPMELLEVRFRLLPQNTVANDAPAVTGMGLGIKMDIGKVAVVNAYTPVGGLGTVRDAYENQPLQFSTLNSTGVFAYPTMYGWRLKYPMFIPANTTLSCVVRPLGQNTYPLSVSVLYIARTWDVRRPIPQTTKVPWVSSYESQVFDIIANTGKQIDSSNPLQIYNPFSTPLEIARLGGRCSYLYNSAGGSVGTVYEDPTLLRSVYSSIQMRSSRGFDLIRTPTSFGAAFPYNWRAWDMPEKWSMSPGEYYSARVNVAAIPSTITASPAQAQVAINLVGYRDVPVSALV